MKGGLAVRAADIAREEGMLLALNNGAVPAVNALDGAALGALDAMGAVRVAAFEDDGALGGLVVTLAPGAPYDSLNYRWFAKRYADFLYVDRVVVSPAARGSGVGRLLYEDVVGRARADGRPVVLSEVNVDPPNPVSMAFHRRLGFFPVAERLNEREGKVVAMMAREL